MRSWAILLLSLLALPVNAGLTTFVYEQVNTLKSAVIDNPARFAFNRDVSIQFKDWTIEGGQARSTLEVSAPGAVSLGFVAKDVSLNGAVVTVAHGGQTYTIDSNYMMGKGVWSKVLTGSTLTVTAEIDASRLDGFKFEIVQLSVGFKDARPMGKRYSTDQAQRYVGGDCRVEYACKNDSELDPLAKSTVYLIFNNEFSCSGSLINSAAGDLVPRVVSAWHCQYGDKENVPVRVYFEKPAACDGVASDGDETSPSAFGGRTLALQGEDDPNTEEGSLPAYGDSWLFEITGNMPAGVSLYLAGFDASDSDLVGFSHSVHHSEANEKQYSKYQDLDKVDALPHPQGNNADYWAAFSDEGDWVEGHVTSGASGSGLTDANFRLIGNLSGGADLGNDRCGDYAFYTRFSKFWDGNSRSDGTPADHLSDEQGTRVVDGVEVTYSALDATVSLSVSEDDVEPNDEVTLTWVSENTLGCSATGSWAGSLPNSGSLAVNVGAQETTLTYGIKCAVDGADDVTDSVQVVVAARPIMTLELASSEVQVRTDETFTLSWEATNAASCVATNDWSGNKAVSGAEVLNEPNEGNYRYGMTCTDAYGGTVSKRVDVTVSNPLVRINSFTTNKAMPSQAESFVLSWDTQNATSCTGSGADFNGSKSTNGNATITLNDVGDSVFNLTCRDFFGRTDTETLTVSVQDLPDPMVSLSSNKSSLIVGESYTLSWSIDNASASNCISEGFTHSGEQGSIQFTDAAVGEHSYSLICLNAANEQGEAATSVSVSEAPFPEIVSFSTSKSQIQERGSFEVLWRVNGAQQCTGAGLGFEGAQPTGNGLLVSRTVTLNEPGVYSYSLSCVNEYDRSDTASVQITVTDVPAPSLSFTTNKTQLVQGESYRLNWAAANASNCQLDGEDVPLSGQQDREANVVGQRVHQLACVNQVAEQTTQTLSVNTLSPAILSVTSDMPNDFVRPNTDYKVSWTSSNAAACVLSGESINASGNSGSVIANQSDSGVYTYSLSCEDGAGNPVSVTYEIQVGVPRFTMIKASDTEPEHGTEVTVEWATEFAIDGTCRLNAVGEFDGVDNKPANGEYTFTYLDEYAGEYSVSCTGLDGNEFKSASACIDRDNCEPEQPVSSGGSGGGGATGLIPLLALSGLVFVRRRHVGIPC